MIILLNLQERYRFQSDGARKIVAPPNNLDRQRPATSRREFVPVRTLRGEREREKGQQVSGEAAADLVQRRPRGDRRSRQGRDVPGGLVLRGAGLAGAVAEGG
jgi:hypothetical protein